MIFVSPNWPYCPQPVMHAHQLTIESPMIQAKMIEANEFSVIAMRYNVSGVPQININDGAGVILGAMPEDNLFTELMKTEAFLISP
jgi:Thioredoxin domain